MNVKAGTPPKMLRQLVRSQAANRYDGRAAQALAIPTHVKASKLTDCVALQVLDDPEQCYAVVLCAVDGPALPPADRGTTSAAVAAAAASGSSTLSAAHGRSAGGGSGGSGHSSAAVAHAAGAGEQPQSATLQRSCQQRGQQSSRRLEAEYAPASTAREGRRAGAGDAAGGAPAEGVTLWQYVSEGGASTTAVDSRARDPLPGVLLAHVCPCKHICKGSAAWQDPDRQHWGVRAPKEARGSSGVQCHLTAATPSTPADSPEALAALERAFSDPLISPGSRRRLQPGSPTAAAGRPAVHGSGGGGSGAAVSAGDLPGITIFAGTAAVTDLTTIDLICNFTRIQPSSLMSSNHTRGINLSAACTTEVENSSCHLPLTYARLLCLSRTSQLRFSAVVYCLFCTLHASAMPCCLQGL